jgi:hypothetical protein
MKFWVPNISSNYRKPKWHINQIAIGGDAGHSLLSSIPSRKLTNNKGN